MATVQILFDSFHSLCNGRKLDFPLHRQELTFSQNAPSQEVIN